MPTPAQKARAARLREKIKAVSGAKRPAPESPVQFIHRRMAELDQSKASPGPRKKKR